MYVYVDIHVHVHACMHKPQHSAHTQMRTHMHAPTHVDLGLGFRVCSNPSTLANTHAHTTRMHASFCRSIYHIDRYENMGFRLLESI